MIARGRLLHPMQEIRVEKWPSSSKEFLSFKNTTDTLKRILKHCHLPDLSQLFKVSPDGNAYEVKGKNMHAKQKYIFLYDDEYAGNHQSISPLKVDCDRVKALLIQLPEVITPELENELKNLEVNITETIEVWPAGRGRRRGDGAAGGSLDQRRGVRSRELTQAGTAVSPTTPYPHTCRYTPGAIQ